MGFSISDIIILLVVVVILAIYRRLDNNNRSLEKVKRYVERVQAEMDEIVSEKVTMLKDIGIEVDVHQKAAKEVLKRIQSIEDDLTSRTDNLEQIGTRLTQYESSLDELVAMTGRAEENIARVRDESDYIDKVGKRIKVVHGKIEELERSLPGLVSSFEKQNADRLNEVESRLVEESRANIDGLENRVDAAAGRVQQFSEDVARMQGEADETYQESLRAIQELHDGLVGGLRDEMNTSVSEARRALEATREEIERAVSETAEQFSLHTRDADDQIERLRGALQSTVDETHAQLEALAESGRSLETDALSALRDYIDQQGRELQEEITRQRDGTIAGHTEQLERIDQELQSRIETLDSRIQAVVVQGREQADGAVKTVETFFSETLDDTRARISAQIETTRAALESQLNEVRNQGQTDSEALSGQFQQLKNDTDNWTEKTRQIVIEMEEQVEHLQNWSREKTEEQTVRIDQHVRETDEQLTNYRVDISSRLDRLDATATERMEALSVQLQTLSRDLESSIHSHQEQTQSRLTNLSQDQQNGYQELQDRYQADMAELSEQFGTRVAQLDELNTRAHQEFEALRKALDDGKSSIDSDIDAFQRRGVQKIDSAAQEMEQRVLGVIENRLTDYEQELGYRFSKIEAVNNDVDELEQNLRNTMERVSERVRNDFLTFGEELRALREQDREEAIQGMDGLRRSMTELEEGLNELKQRAYDNVSEKLKVFEDEFFADLRERSATMEAQIAAWRNEVDQRLGAIRKEQEEHRSSLEEQYSEELRTRLHQFQDTANGQLNKIDTQLDSFRSGIGTRMEATEQSLNGFEESLSEELESLKDRSYQTFRQEFSQLDNRVQGQLKTFESEVDEQIAQVRRAVGTGKEELEAMIEAARSDVNVWQTRVLNEMRSSDAEVSNQLADARVKLSENIQELKREYASERDELIEQSREERNMVRQDLDSAASELQKLQNQLDDQSRVALEEFSQRYQELRNRTDAHQKHISDRLEDQSQEFRSLVTDTRDQFYAMREKLLGKLEEESRTLGTTLEEIEKKQKSFIDQTGIFERADTLKVQLQDDIEELKNEISRVESLRGEVRDIEGQFGKIRKMSADATEKMARFTADKRRIDLLEEDYRRLINLAQSVEAKIEQVGTSDEQLQEITARLKSLSELEQEVESRFDRLEKRRSAIDETTDGIEQNRVALDAANERIESISLRVEQFPDAVSKLSGQLKQVAAHRKETETAVQNLATLKETLADVESRMEELKTAREWLARTETRLEEIRRDAGEQVKLLGSIMRDETRKSGGKDGSGGAPSLNARETVQKLAHQGWNVDEIARATKMSKGEVELILELSGRK